jgi:hypothetical protein
MCIYTINYNYIYIHYIYIHYIYTYCNCINIIINDIVHDLLYERVHTEKTYNYLGVQEDLQLNWGNYRDVKRGILPWSAVEVLALQMFVTSQVEAPHPLDSLSPFDCSGTDSKISWPQISAVICRKKRRSNLKKTSGSEICDLEPFSFVHSALASGALCNNGCWIWLLRAGVGHMGLVASEPAKSHGSCIPPLVDPLGIYMFVSVFPSPWSISNLQAFQVRGVTCPKCWNVEVT